MKAILKVYALLAVLSAPLALVQAQSNPSGTLMPAAVYNGGHNGTTKVGLRIANGGAGQSGLIGAWGDAFINYMVGQGHEPFTVEWYLGDTTQSIGYLERGQVDATVTYNEAAERDVYDSGMVSAWLYGFHDHFYLVGPPSNPAQLSTNDTVLVMARKIVQSGNEQAAAPPTNFTTTRFLSRYDKSATNIKESEIFIKIGQVPWAYDYSKWYHQYPCFPIQALEAASLLGEYTLTDRGTWLSSTPDVQSRLTIFKAGTDNETDILLNPARVLIAKEDKLIDKDIGKAFGEWVVLYDAEKKNGGQNVIESFTGTSQTGETKEPLYTRAPANWSPANSTAGQ